MSGVVIDESTELSLGDVCRACSMHAEWVVTLVEEGVVEPVIGQNQTSWRFTGLQLRSLQTVSRLQRDLGVNLAGAALALELIEEVESLRTRIAVLESHE